MSVAKAFDQLRADEPLGGARVLIIVENLPVPFDRRVWLEARTLQAAGAKVTVICPLTKAWPAREETISGIDILRHPLPPDVSSARGYLREYSAALFWQTRLAWRVWRKGGIDVIHGCNPPDLIALVAAPLRVFGVRYLFDHHDISPELYEAKFGRRDLFWRLMLLCERMTFALASVSIATNESYREIAITRGKMRSEDVFVVRSGPDLDTVRPVSAEPRWRNGRDHLVGYVGVMGEQEGIDLLLEAVARIVQNGRQDIQFALVGGGPSLEALKEMSRDLGLEEYVTFTGRASDADLLSALSTADLCVNPDRVNPMNDKSTMNKIMEYMALGKPIVQFDVREGRISAGEASSYAAANDPDALAHEIVTLIDDPERRARMGSFGQERVHRDLGWDKSIAPLMQAYRRILKRD